MIAERFEPKGLAPDATPIADVARTEETKQAAIDGSTSLLNAILVASGLPVPKPAPRPRVRDYIIVARCTPPIERIQRKVAEFYSIPLAEMRSKRRFRKMARPRQIAMYFARELTPMSLPSIGNRFGKRDHTTVMHAIKTVERLVATDPEFAADVAALREELSE
jgi:chromosomal replication initiator protein